ncbi:MAG: porin family protein [Bacteroidales bacterium]|nr:porin family protein [Bacteroidales bacterium]
MKYFLSILILLFLFLSSKSQSFYGGIIAGTTISQVDGDNYGGYHKISPLGGVFVRNTFNDKWGMTAGIEYKRKGSKEVQKNDYNEITRLYNLSLDYIEVPIMLSRNIKKIGIPKFFLLNIPNDLYLYFGISYSYLINSKEEINGSINPLAKDFHNYEIANHVGLNYRLNRNWLVCWRFSYTLPLLPIREHPGGQAFWFNRGQYNNNMSFALKYEF